MEHEKRGTRYSREFREQAVALADSVHTESGTIDFDVMRDPVLRRAAEWTPRARPAAPP